MEPKLPPELERLIFLYAYQHGPKDVQNLICVARRVEEWLCPTIFKVVLILFDEKFPFKPFTLSTFRHYGRYIKHLAIDLGFFRYYHDENPFTLVFRHSEALSRLFRKVLTACPNLIKLWVRGEVFTPLKYHIPTLSSLSLITHLTINLPSLLKQLPSLPKKSWFNPNPSVPNPIFPGITHLETGYLFDWRKEDKQTLLLSIHFPNLTHFAFNPQSSDSFQEGLNLVLERCTGLELVVLRRGYRTSRERQEPLMDDCRVVEVYGYHNKLWKNEVDLWEVAKRQREGDVDVLMSSLRR